MGDVFDNAVATVTQPSTATPAPMGQYAKPGPYTTNLNPQQEQQFQAWVKQNKVPWQDSPTADYDMRGYWLARQQGDPNAKRAANLHFPDTWKTPYDLSFSNESKYALPTAPRWNGNQLIDPQTGKVVFDEAYGSDGQQAERLAQKAATTPDVFDNAVSTAMGKAPTPSPAAAPAPSVGERMWTAAKNTVTPLINPPQTHTEAGISLVGGTPALTAFRMAKSLVDAAKHMSSAAANEYPQAVQDFNKAVDDYHAHNYSGLAADATSAAADVAGVVQPQMSGPANEIRQYVQDTKPGGNLAGDLTRSAINATAATIPMLGEEGAAVAPEEAETEAPGLVKQAIHGEDVIQPQLHSTLRGAAEQSAEDAGIADQTLPATHTQGIRTLMDEPIKTLADTERATYDAVNQASGTDLKALYDHAEEVQDALDDPTNIANRSALQADLQQTQSAIQTGEKQAAANGVDPGNIAKAKAMTQQRYAMQDLKAKVFNNDTVVKGNQRYSYPESVDVDAAIRQAEKLNKPSKFAPEGTPTRLQQALGEDGADDFLQNLYDAKKAGNKAIKVQKISKMALSALRLAGEETAGIGIWKALE